MIYFISDLHGDIEFLGLKRYFDIATDDDLLIVLGDIGLNFDKTAENRKFTEYFLSIKNNIAIVDGNHENYAYLDSFPEEEWMGGTVRRLTENIVHLKRGNIFTINGKTFFVFGGCKSSPKWKEMGLWHEGDEPTEEEIRLGHINLEKYNYNVDYILTHKYEATPGRGTVCPQFQEFTSFIENNVQYKTWYSGHGHVNRQVDEKHILVYDDPEPLDLSV